MNKIPSIIVLTDLQGSTTALILNTRAHNFIDQHDNNIIIATW